MFLRVVSNKLPPILISCRLLHRAYPPDVNFRTEGRKLLKEDATRRRRRPQYDNEIDFGKVRCNLAAKRVKEEKPQHFPPDPDAPVELPYNPYEKAPRKCLLCDLNIKLDYKNGRFLQQFVSSFSGRVYDRHVTGLCPKQHDALLHTIATSRRAGFMPILVKEPRYLRDPKLFDPLKPIRPHSYDDP